jgi:hypothetical protein
MACPCCNPPFCCPSGDPVRFTLVISGTPVYLSGSQFLSSIASSMVGTYLLVPTTEQPSGYSGTNTKWYSIASDDISTFPTSNGSWLGLAFDGRVWAYGLLGCVDFPRANVSDVRKKTAANVTSGGFTTVSMATMASFQGSVGDDCTSDKTFTGNYNVEAFSVTYASNGSISSILSGVYQMSASLSHNF